MLFAGLFAAGRTTVIEPKATRDHTERLMAAAGIPVDVNGLRISIDGYGPRVPPVRACEWMVPGDFSSAAFWLVAAATREGASVTVREVGLNPRRTALLDVLRRMGADIRVEPDSGGSAGEAMGRVTVRGGRLRGTEIGGDEIPNLIDEIPILAVAGALAEGQTVIRDAAELRIKESDRIATMAKNLGLLGVEVEERPDGMVVKGPARLRAGAAMESYGDHRVVMAMTVLACAADRPVRIRDIACVATSYPGFWDDLKRMGGHAETDHRD